MKPENLERAYLLFDQLNKLNHIYAWHMAKDENAVFITKGDGGSKVEVPRHLSMKVLDSILDEIKKELVALGVEIL